MTTSDELIERARAHAEAIELATRAVDELNGVGESEHGAVAVEVDGHGTLTGIYLAPGACGLAPEELGRLVVQASQAAAGWVAQRRTALLALVEGDAVTDAWDAAAGRLPRADVIG